MNGYSELFQGVTVEVSMDIGYTTSSGKFSLRSAALVISDNRLLVARSDKYDCYYTVGGGIRENEPSDKAIVRELYEETGCHLEVDRLVFIQERFFQCENASHHEVVFFYLMKNANIQLQNGVNTDQQNEHLYWVPIEGLEKINLVPAFLKTAIQNIPNEITHIVSYE